MTIYSVKAEVVEGARDTGRVLSTTVMAKDRLDAAILGEKALDRLLPHPARQYTHAISVEPLVIPASSLAVAA